MAGALNHWNTAQDHPLRRLLVRRYEVAAALVSGDVLDWACGFGLGSWILAPHCRRLHGLDMDPQAIAVAATRVTYPHCTFSLGDLEQQASFSADWLVCCETLEHLHAPETFLRRAQQGVRGLILSVPVTPTVGRGNRTHVHDFTRAQVQAFFDAPLAPGTLWRRVHDELLPDVRGQRTVTEYYLGAWTCERRDG